MISGGIRGRKPFSPLIQHRSGIDATDRSIA
jgi:hypothetical protein